LVAVPAKFNLPVCAGIMQKAKFAHRLGDKPHTALEFAVAMHALAIIQCEIGVEMWLRKYIEREITHIIAENNDEVRYAAREAHVVLRDEAEMAKEGFVNHACFPFKRIRDGLQFTTKAESRLLQIADACAWAIRRAANDAPNAFRLYQPVRGQIVLLDDQQQGALGELPS
jgi:hypothetical protein